MLNRLSTGIYPLVRKVELPTKSRNSDHDESLGDKASQYAGAIARCINRAENTCSNDSTNCAASGERC